MTPDRGTEPPALAYRWLLPQVKSTATIGWLVRDDGSCLPTALTALRAKQALTHSSAQVEQKVLTHLRIKGGGPCVLRRRMISERHKVRYEDPQFLMLTQRIPQPFTQAERISWLPIERHSKIALYVEALQRLACSGAFVQESSSARLLPMLSDSCAFNVNVSIRGGSVCGTPHQRVMSAAVKLGPG